MKKATKFFAVLLVVVLAFSLAACKTTASKDITVDVFWYDFADPFLTTVREAAIAAFNDAGITATMINSENDQAKQTQQVKTAISGGSDLLIVNIVTSASLDAAQEIVDLAKEADIPIILFNREPTNAQGEGTGSDAIINSYAKCAFVGTRAAEAGELQGQAAAEFLLKDENWKDGKSIYDLDGDGVIRYLMFRGEHGNAEAFGRTLYSVQFANKDLAGKLELKPSVANETSNLYPNDGVSNFFLYGNWNGKIAGDLMRTAMATYSLTDGSIEFIFANNDDQALGVIEALNEKDFNTGAAGAGYIPVFGVDATAPAQQAIKDGKMTGTVLQSATAMADALVDLSKAIAGGGSLDDKKADYPTDSGVYKIRIPYQIVK